MLVPQGAVPTPASPSPSALSSGAVAGIVVSVIAGASLAAFFAVRNGFTLGGMFAPKVSLLASGSGGYNTVSSPFQAATGKSAAGFA